MFLCKFWDTMAWWAPAVIVGTSYIEELFMIFFAPICCNHCTCQCSICVNCFMKCLQLVWVYIRKHWSSIVTLQGRLSHIALIVMHHYSIAHHCHLLWYCKTMALTVHNFISAMYNLTSICDTQHRSNKNYHIQKIIRQKGSGITENQDDEHKDWHKSLTNLQNIIHTPGNIHHSTKLQNQVHATFNLWNGDDWSTMAMASSGSWDLVLLKIGD